jgi:PTS system mannitol-specific IIC component
VGAGDASLAGFLGAGGGGPAALAAAVAHGAAAVTLPGSALPTPADLDPAAVTVTADIPLDRPLGAVSGGPAPADHQAGTDPGTGAASGGATASSDRAQPGSDPVRPMTDLAHLKHLKGTSVRARVQRLGGYLAGMVMPNLGAFIAWGLITAMFIPTGWLPDASLARLVDPMITYLLPVLIGYTGGRLVHGQRGAVVGAVATVGVAVGSDVPMFLGAMIVGPLTAYLLKLVDGFTARHTRPGFEMLVDNFSAGIVGGAMAIAGLRCVGPVVSTLTRWAGHGVRDLVNAHLLPLVSVIVEPAKVLFLNNAINHGVLAPLGVEQASQSGKSVLFMIESNPGPGLGILLAYLLFGPRRLRATVPGAIVIQFLGGIHEIYFPYVLMKPRLVLAAIAGGMTGVATATVTHAGLVATPSPGSIFAYLAVTPRGGYLPVLASVAAAAAVSFTTGAALLRTSRVTEPETGPARSGAAPPGAAEPGTAQPTPVPLDAVEPEGVRAGDTRSVTASAVSNVVVACDAGMGSSVMLASQLTRRLKPYGVTATHTPVNDIPQGTQVVVTHANLADRAHSTAPDAVIIPFQSFLNDPAFDLLEAAFRDGGEIRA